MSNETQHTPAEVRGRIIRASILPFEDEETMIAGLRAGADAVERGELDAEDFVGTWSQYLRELFRRASSVPAPADVRERVAKEVYLWEATRFGADESWALRRWREESNTRRELYFNVADRILALLRTPHGEGEADEQASCTCEWMHPTLGTINPHWPAVLDPECIVHREAALRSEAQGEDRWEDVVFGPITEAYNEAHAAAPPTGARAMASDPCLSVPCPLCRAPAGEPCHEITRERAERRPHNRRRWAYREIFGRWPEDETDEEIEAALAEMERCHSEGGGDDA